MIEGSVLVSDQVFQLNTFLWALEDLPDDGQVRPVLRQAGYYLGSIGRSVSVPRDELTTSALSRLAESDDRSPCRPDLWLRHASDPVHPIIELKSHGFGTDSTNRRQALKLIVAATNLAPSLAEPGDVPGHVLYATVTDDADELSATLAQLAGDLNAEGVATAPTGTIGLAIVPDGVTLSSPTPSDLPSPLASALKSQPVVLHGDGVNDLQPLYLVPWIPGIADSQNADLHAAGLRELTARLLSQMLAAVGQARPPTTLVMDGNRLLSDATFGVFDRWRDADRRNFSEAAAKIVDKTLKSVADVRRLSSEVREIELPSTEVQDAMTDRIEHADPADPSSNLAAALGEQLSLFNED